MVTSPCKRGVHKTINMKTIFNNEVEYEDGFAILCRVVSTITVYEINYQKTTTEETSRLYTDMNGNVLKFNSREDLRLFVYMRQQLGLKTY